MDMSPAFRPDKIHSFYAFFCSGKQWRMIHSLVMTNSLLLKIAIYSEFSHERWWFSTALLNYQRVISIFMTCWSEIDGYIPSNPHKTTIFLWFSYGFPSSTGENFMSTENLSDAIAAWDGKLQLDLRSDLTWQILNQEFNLDRNLQEMIATHLKEKHDDYMMITWWFWWSQFISCWIWFNKHLGSHF